MTDDSRAFKAWPERMPKIDTGRANVARAWNYMVGGKDNFEVDREAARQLMQVAPVIRIAAPASRAVVPGSYLAIMHPASDLDPALLEAGQRWNQLAAQPVRLRSRADMTRFLAGLELVEPGLVTVPEWRPDASARPAQAKADMSHGSHVHLVSIATARHFHLSWRW